MEVEKENQNGNEMEINETKNEPKVEITEEQKDETKDLVGHGGQGKRTFRPRTNPKLERRGITGQFPWDRNESSNSDPDYILFYHLKLNSS